MELTIRNIVIAAAVAFIATLVVLPYLSRMAEKIGLIDKPSRRKVYKGPRPLVGGLGIVIGFSVSSVIVLPVPGLAGFISGVFILLSIGFLDDLWDIGHSWKFISQIGAVLLMVYLSNTVLYNLGNLASYGDIVFHRAAVLLTVFSTVGVINAINMIDGLDGLAGSLSCIALLSFSIVAYVDGQTVLLMIGLVFSGAILAFLKYNWHPAKLFLGDAGSMVVGYVLTFVAISLTQKHGSSIAPVVPLVILVVPLVDAVSVMLRRMLAGKSAFKPDRTHLHHILMSFGFNEKAAVMIIIALSIAFAILGICGYLFKVAEHYLFAVCMSYFFLHTLLSLYFSKKVHLSNAK